MSLINLKVNFLNLGFVLLYITTYVQNNFGHRFVMCIGTLNVCKVNRKNGGLL
jgi:hypothetical protein